MYKIVELNEREITNFNGKIIQVINSTRKESIVGRDSIVTTCLVSIFSPLLNERNDHTKIVEKYVEKEIVEKDETICISTEAEGN